MTVILSRTAVGNFTVTVLDRTGGLATGTHSHHSQLGVLPINMCRLHAISVSEVGTKYNL
jgi:hypothetical protein